MNRCPPEIWAEIFASACTDDGRTGRSLSLVSHFVNDVSKPYKLQSVAVFGPRQILRFTSLLERLPPSRRRVSFIFLSHFPPQAPGEQQCVCDEREIWNQLHKPIMRIFRAIAPCLRAVHWSFLVVVRIPSFLQDLCLPVLEELVLDGPALFRLGHSVSKVSNSMFPALKRLDVTSELCDPLWLVEVIRNWMPCLTYLRMCASLDAYPGNWFRLTSQVRKKDLTLPARLEKMYIRAPTDPGLDRGIQLHARYQQVMGRLKNLVEMEQRIVLLSPREDEKLPAQTALGSTWMGSIPWW